MMEAGRPWSRKKDLPGMHDGTQGHLNFENYISYTEIYENSNNTERVKSESSPLPHFLIIFPFSDYYINMDIHIDIDRYTVDP